MDCVRLELVSIQTSMHDGVCIYAAKIADSRQTRKSLHCVYTYALLMNEWTQQTLQFLQKNNVFVCLVYVYA